MNGVTSSSRITPPIEPYRESDEDLSSGLKYEPSIEENKGGPCLKKRQHPLIFTSSLRHIKARLDHDSIQSGSEQQKDGEHDSSPELQAPSHIDLSPGESQEDCDFDRSYSKYPVKRLASPIPLFLSLYGNNIVEILEKSVEELALLDDGE